MPLLLSVLGLVFSGNYLGLLEPAGVRLDNNRDELTVIGRLHSRPRRNAALDVSPDTVAPCKLGAKYRLARLGRPPPASAEKSTTPLSTAKESVM